MKGNGVGDGGDTEEGNGVEDDEDDEDDEDGGLVEVFSAVLQTTADEFAREQAKEKDLQLAFETLDTDGDGCVTTSEVAVFVKQMLGGDGVADEGKVDRLVRRIMAADSNSDGRIDEQEFRHLARSLQGELQRKDE